MARIVLITFFLYSFVRFTIQDPRSTTSNSDSQLYYSPESYGKINHKNHQPGSYAFTFPGPPFPGSDLNSHQPNLSNHHSVDSDSQESVTSHATSSVGESSQLSPSNHQSSISNLASSISNLPSSIYSPSGTTTDTPISSLSKPPDFLELLASSLTTTPSPMTIKKDDAGNSNNNYHQQFSNTHHHHHQQYSPTFHPFYNSSQMVINPPKSPIIASIPAATSSFLPLSSSPSLSSLSPPSLAVTSSSSSGAGTGTSSSNGASSTLVSFNQPESKYSPQIALDYSLSPSHSHLNFSRQDQYQSHQVVSPDPIDWSALLLNHNRANENLTTFSTANTFLPGSDLPQTERASHPHHHSHPSHSSSSSSSSNRASSPRRRKKPRPTSAPSTSTTSSTTTTTTTTRPPKYYISDPEEEDGIIGSEEDNDDDDPPRDIYAQFSDSDPQVVHHSSSSIVSNRAKPLGHHQYRRPLSPYYYSELAPASSTSNMDYNHEEDLQELPQDSHYNAVRPNHYFPQRYQSLGPVPSRDSHETGNGGGYYQPSYFLEDIHRQGLSPNGDRQPPGLSAWSSGLTGFLLGIIPLSLLVASIAPAFMSVPVGAAMAAGAAGRRRRKKRDLIQDRESLRFLHQLLEKNPQLSNHFFLQKLMISSNEGKSKRGTGMT